MKRTSDRPIVTGELTKKYAIIYSSLTGISGFLILYFLTTPLAGFIALSANLFYTFVYTLILKPRTNQNIVIGGAAGAAPVLIGWAATGTPIEIGTWVLFLLVFMWTPAHFWALAIENKSDYENADFPMLSTQESYERTSIFISIYSCATVLISIIAAPILQLGIVYLIIAIFFGGNLMLKSFYLFKKSIAPIKYFIFSNTYLEKFDINLDVLLSEYIFSNRLLLLSNLFLNEIDNFYTGFFHNNDGQSLWSYQNIYDNNYHQIVVTFENGLAKHYIDGNLTASNNLNFNSINIIIMNVVQAVFLLY